MIRAVRTISGETFMVLENKNCPYKEIIDNDSVVLVKTKFNTTVRIYAHAIESVECID